jgi:ATP-dependent Clp protease ATP-binding subunit ClpC
MSRRRRSDEEPADVEAEARAAARTISERYGTPYPEPETLADDAEFVALSELLAGFGVTFDVVDRLARANLPVLAAAAQRAVSLRRDVPRGWTDWAFRRLKQAYAGEVTFLLRALEQHAEPPLLARVLARSDHDWTEGWLLHAVTAFAERRVAAGEAPTADEWAAFVEADDIEVVSTVVAALDGVLPDASRQAFDDWKAGRDQLDYFASFGRLVDLPEERAALTSVGGRSAVVAALEAAVRENRSALVVGPHGVGKSAVVREALRAFRDEDLLVVEAGASEVMAGQVWVGELETRVREIAARAAAGRRVVWIVPGFEGMLWAGQHSRSPRGLLDALLPYVASGQLVLVGELAPEAYELVAAQRPAVASLFETLRLESLSRTEAVAVARDWRVRENVSVDDATIEETQDLAERYVPSVAAPAGVLRLLKSARGDADADAVSLEAVLASLSELSGLPLHVVDPEVPLDLDEVRTFFSSRVLGQPEAVECLVDRIALVKAGLTDPTRPLGVFLFVGPTGTGKTEIAKALAEFLFGSQDRLVRLDMSEFQTPDSLERLLADQSSHHEAAALISSVRAKPFSVVLLDEFEKAHPNIWSVFLQLFDDGRLTDRRGRTADFRQCVVVLTSNLGAAVGSGRALGFAADGGPRFRAADVERELSRVFRPELLNRIDRVVVFHPFEPAQMRALLERELAQVIERRGFRGRPWAVEWDDSALELLAEKGFSPELGARPLKRAIERYVLAPLAAAIVSRSFPEGEQFLFVSAGAGEIVVTFVDPDAPEQPDEPAVEPAPAALRLERLVLDPTGAPEERALLEAETARLRALVDGDDWRGCKERDLDEMRGAGFWESGDRFAVLARIEYVDRVEAALRTAEKLAARLRRTGGNGHGAGRELVSLLAQRLYVLDRACTGVGPELQSDAFVEVRPVGSEEAEAEFALRLREMYESWARLRGMRVRTLDGDGRHLLAVSGIAAYRILAPETGLHVFESPEGESSFDRAAVRVTVAARPAAAPDADPLELARRALGALPPATAVVRRYRDRPSPLVRDAVREWRTGRLDRVLGGAFDVIV